MQHPVASQRLHALRACGIGSVAVPCGGQRQAHARGSAVHVRTQIAVLVPAPRPQRPCRVHCARPPAQQSAPRPRKAWVMRARVCACVRTCSRVLRAAHHLHGLLPQQGWLRARHWCLLVTKACQSRAARALVPAAHAKPRACAVAHQVAPCRCAPTPKPRRQHPKRSSGASHCSAAAQCRCRVSHRSHALKRAGRCATHLHQQRRGLWQQHDGWREAAGAGSPSPRRRRRCCCA